MIKKPKLTLVSHEPENGDRIECCICGYRIEEDPPGSGWTLGHNADPLATGHGRCCDECNYTRVIPARLGRMGK